MRASFFLSSVLLTLFVSVQVADATYAERSHEQRGSCGALVKPYPPGQGCRSKGTCGSDSDSDSGSGSDSSEDSGESGLSSVSPSSASSSTPACVPISSLPSTLQSTLASDASSDASTDASSVASSDASTDASSVASSVASSDASSDASTDASSVASSDASTDASSVASSDASSDASSECPEGTISWSDYTELTGSTESAELVECPLTDYLYNLSLLLNDEQRQLFIELIVKIQVNILADTSLTEDQLVVRCSYELQLFFEANVDIQIALQYQTLGDFGFLIDFIYIAYQIQIEITAPIVQLEGGSCPVFEAIRNKTDEEGDEETTDVCEELIANITIILQSGSLSYTQQQAQIYLLFQALISANASWTEFFYSIQIEGYGSLQYYIDVCQWYYKMTVISQAISGSASMCPVVEGLNDAWQNTSFSISVRNQLQELYQQINDQFELSANISVRLDALVSICFDQFELSPYLEEFFAQITCGGWGNIYDLIFISCICENDGCDDINAGPGELDGASTPIEASSEASTEASTETSTEASTEASTTEESTTTAPQHTCSSRWSIVAVYQYNATVKSSYFTEAVQTAYDSWSASVRAGFNTYKNKIWNAVFNTTATHQQIFSSVIDTCASYNANNDAKQAVLYNISIVQWGGTIGQFVACGSSCGCS